jgi:hypothetical protein
MVEISNTSGNVYIKIMQLFDDNTEFYHITNEGGLIPCRKEPISGKYQIDGHLVI